MMTMIITCAGCEKPILDKFLLNVLDRTWHANCVRCHDCHANLTEKCFSREGKLFCRNDFFRRYGTKCTGCSQGISPSDLVRKAKDKVFHLKCFTCLVCRRQLSTGEELYVLDDNKFICKDDYLSGKGGQESFLNSGSDEEEEDVLEHHITKPAHTETNNNTLSTPTPPAADTPASIIIGTTPTTPTSQITEKESMNDSEGSIDGDAETRDSQTENKSPEEGNVGSKRRGPRTTIKAKQLEVLKTAFSQTPKPTRHIREQLAKETGLPMRVIQVWFQNKRSKERRLKQLTSMGRGPFFGSSRKMRGLPMPSFPEDAPGYPYFDNKFQEFAYGNQGFHDFFPGQPGQPGQPIGFSQPPGVPPTSMEQPLPGGGPMGEFGGMNPPGDPNFMPPGDIMASQRASPDYMPPVSAPPSSTFSEHPMSEGLVW